MLISESLDLSVHAFGAAERAHHVAVAVVLEGLHGVRDGGVQQVLVPLTTESV